MNNDNMQVSFAFEPKWGSRMSKNWQNVTGPWAGLVNKLCTTLRTQETFEQYKNGTHDFKGYAKDKGAFVGGLSMDGTRRKATIVSRTLITLDIDHGDKYDGDIRTLIEHKLQNIMYCYYTTHSHSSSAPRIRVVVPLASGVSPDRYEPIARRLAEYIDPSMKIWDETTYQASRLMYLPSTSIDGEFYAGHNLGSQATPLNGDAVLTMYDDYLDPQEWPKGPQEKDKVKRYVFPHEYKDEERPFNLRNWFINKYSVPQVIEMFLSDVYVPSSSISNRYTFTGGEVADGVIYYDDGKTYHQNESDPCSGMSCDSWMIVKINLCEDDDDIMRDWLRDEGIYEDFIKDIKSWF